MSKSLQLLLALTGLLSTAHGAMMAYREPTPFAKAQPDAVHGWSPNPTKAPVVQQYGSMPNNQLFGRDNSNTDLTDSHICGWTSGISASPISCQQMGDGTSTLCAYLTQFGAPFNVWCCPYDDDGRPNTNDCPYISSCISFNDPRNTNTLTQVQRGASNEISCPGILPECTTMVLQQWGGASDTYLSYGCGTVATTYEAVQTISHSTTTSTSTTNSATIVPIVETAAPKSTGSSTGAIAGGVVGGVLGVALIGGIIGYLVYRKKKARQPPMREVSQYTGQ